MSLRGRWMMDRLKNHRFNTMAQRFTLPVPHEIPFWEGVYQKLGSKDSFEWGDLSFQEHLREYDYREWLRHTRNKDMTMMLRTDDIVGMYSEEEAELQRTTFVDTLFVSQATSNENNDDEQTSDSSYSQPILVLGCGNSKLGEDMCDAGWTSITQVDVVSRVLECMEERCAPYVDRGVMQFVQDDATQLSAFSNASIAASIDKGLLDVLYCANRYDQVQDIMRSAYRVLRPGGVLCVFSFSRPEFFLPCLLGQLEETRDRLPPWKEVRVQALEHILLYRFQKKNDAMALRKGAKRKDGRR